ncbi:hypothetical protein [Clostridium beijerinckii]|uniref:Uncharacterized protein n=1 Tax=Clostridium beijerinckii TaxID=1520 RepID=A0AAE5LRD3_CLOBE|nr:hypothetical protein [Clostridium beijerinckii]NSB15828.1 hypothetical protein [Clostridium beijerinckii]OOM27951.1 hypothetical protein CLOBE_28690 [Clostridium beijerinckii]
MEDFFGGSLLIKDAFSNTFNQFDNSVSKASNGFKMFTSSIGQSERANRLATQNMKSQIAQLSQTYTKEGYTMGQALRKATGEISREAPKSGNSWVDAFGRIKQVGVDAFTGIGNKMQSFSNSTLGMVAKITGGLISLKAAKEGLGEGFKTAMEFQDSRMTLDTLYGSATKGGEKFKMATDFANETPWEESETVGSLVKMKAYGLDDSKKMMTMMSDLGATFKSMGQNMDTATEAYADMINGQWERMTQFGIKRETLDKFAKDNGMKAFDNKQGQITDKDALSKVFEQYMKDKNYTGMTDKLSQTASGKLSTMTGNLKKSLAELVGIAEDGGVKSGSLFERFINGMQNFISKMDSFAGSENFNKISNALGDIGGAISTGFGYLMEHPEIASSLIKLSIGMWGLGKVSSIITTFTGVIGSFSEGGILAGLVPALAPIAPYVLAIGGGFLVLKSLLSPDGMLNRGLSWLIGKIPVFGEELQKGWDENSNALAEFFNEAKEGWELILGIKSPDDIFNKQDENVDPSTLKWYGGKDGKTLITDNSNVKFATAGDLMKSGAITKTNASNQSNNKTEVNFNINKVEKTADIDEFMEEAVKRIDKHSQIRNNLDD